MDSTSTRKAGIALTFLFSLVAGTALGANSESGETRVSESSFYADDGRTQAAPNRVSTDEFGAMALSGSRSEGTRGSEQQKLSATESRTPNTDFWFYASDVELFADDDRDGFYHGIDLWFDVDTIYFSADVYAVVYLSLEGGPWIEYAETETFSIFGTSATDDYVIVTELLSGYPAGSYDILIELFDTFDNSFVADFGPESTSEQAFLPLEDAERDTPFISPGPPIAVSHGGGGALDWLSLVVFGLLAAVALRRRPSRQLQVARGERSA